ncbi:unnamed protein product [Allacma fusca]|uniref:Band 3 cytoplasmic domain-containing protein n=1 Tax=Allacma fusca TaxID=39272 RepID=A0A8J2JEF9_9HEXA|nr:unnamed protein product [Allacma fusca]
MTGELLLSRHHQTSSSNVPQVESNGSGMDRSPSGGSIGRNQSGTNLAENGDVHASKGNTHFMRKIPAGAEASNILVGEVDFLEKPLSAFVRLSQAVVLGDLTEVPVPTRFVFVLLGPMVSLVVKLESRAYGIDKAFE